MGDTAEPTAGRRWWLKKKKVASLFQKNRGDTVSCRPALGDTNPSDATASAALLMPSLTPSVNSANHMVNQVANSCFYHPESGYHFGVTISVAYQREQNSEMCMR